MPSQTNWPLLSKVLERPIIDTLHAAGEIICRGEIPVTAVRGDISGSTTPESVEALLAQATRAFPWFSTDTITATFYATQSKLRAILGPRSDLRTERLIVAWLYNPRSDEAADCEIKLRNVRVHLPSLVAAMEAAGHAIDDAPSPQAKGRAQPPRGAYIGELAAFMQCLQRAKRLDDLSDDDVAKRFEDEVAAKVQAGKSVLKLPQHRNVANQVAKRRAMVART